ncbi:MAG: hypothetical protein NC231_14950 [Bacillus sp. (in: Bacteria)]|nr:hypothetical protein [Bacillus sp. (in: firmicutes)]MCM1427405.1 hypothetical protein [Eubacterium sp.]
MTDQEKEIVAKASVPMSIANGFRILFMLIALFLLLFIFFGNKLWEGAAWYEAFLQKAYSFLLWDILFMFISTILKMIFTVRYNHIVKNM